VKALVLALALFGLAMNSLSAATVEQAVLLTLNSTTHCVGASWTLKISNAAPSAAIRLKGTSSETAWEIPQWAKTDASGNFSTGGTYAVDAAAKHTLRVEIAGSTSNTVSLEVVNCGWRRTGSLNTARSGNNAMLLKNGKVLVIGWPKFSGVGTYAELYNPASETWSVATKLDGSRDGTATLLPNGKILFSGSSGDFPVGPLKSAEIYDPETETWSVTSNLNFARMRHSATLLLNGQVLVAGGSDDVDSSDGLQTSELYDPGTGTWRMTGSLPYGVYSHTTTLLPNGKVLLVVGGSYNEGYPIWTGAALYDPATETWSTIRTPNLPRYYHTATLLHNGKVLVVGGTSASLPVLSVELYDPETDSWSRTGTPNTPRYTHTATLLPNGKVLLMGGVVTWGPTGSMSDRADLYDPDTGIWSAAATLNTARAWNSATVLPSGKVLVAGGIGPTPAATSGSSWDYLDSAELYDGGFETPLLTLNSTTYCIGDPWSLMVIHSAPSASVQLLGVSNRAFWTIARWGTTDQDGNFSANGTMASGTEGSHTLSVEISGVRSNAVSFAVSKCKP
jgi:N-acetylneuraminic acid mutarotase